MSRETDQRQFADIYNLEADSLFRFCLLRVSDREKALDLTQETFARLWSSMVIGKKLESPRAFIYKIARNLIIDWYRKKKSVSLEGLSGQDDKREFDIADEMATRNIEINSDGRQALKMLDKLEMQYREVIYFRYMEDLSPQEIAQVLDLNANIVSIRITRGMEALRKLMGIESKND